MNKEIANIIFFTCFLFIVTPPISGMLVKKKLQFAMTTEFIQPSTPLMKQYFAIKQQYPDAIVLFQVGDFYELFYEDAVKSAPILGITLTTRGKNNGEPIPLCGVPVHAIHQYLPKLVKSGFRVALCDQLQEPTPGKVVERGVTKVYTPGTLIESNLLEEKSSSYICSLYGTQEQTALLFVELLTAQLFGTVIPNATPKLIESELLRFNPDEILLTSMPNRNQLKSLCSYYGFCITSVEAVKHEESCMRTWMAQQFKQELIDELISSPVLYAALKLFYSYFAKNQQAALEQFRQIHFYKPDDYLLLDVASQKNLELVVSIDGSRANTLFSVLDNAVTSMGSRTIKKWLLRPLFRKDSIIQRQEVVTLFKKEFVVLMQLRELLKKIGDLERIIGRISLGRDTLSDYLALLAALEVLPEFKKILDQFNGISLINLIVESIGDFSSIKLLLSTSINRDNTKDWIINSCFDQKLDQMRQIIEDSNILILELEKKEQLNTGINSLKVRYNQVHGYYVEITKPNLHLVPAAYIRHQTLVGKERFTTVELKKLEAEIVSARHEVDLREQDLFNQIKTEVRRHVASLRKSAQAISHFDALLSFAYGAYQNNYIKPEFNMDAILEIREGRHPVIEQTMNSQFISNDILMDNSHKLWIITGPNMGGKSTFMRQTALMIIMAQSGSFIPAKSANLPIIDRIFTRIGAGDNVTQGKSTFFVEMEETAIICTQATQKSLVILDEVGRGTSTYDGLAIAQAVIEFIYQNINAYCLFATHYHELTQLVDQFPGVANYYAASKKTESGILLLYKILPGIAEGSFGIEVAKLAQLPRTIITRSQQLLSEITNPKNEINIRDNHQVDVRQLHYESLLKFVDSFKTIDYEELSPKQAFDLLWSIKEKINSF